MADTPALRRLEASDVVLGDGVGRITDATWRRRVAWVPSIGVGRKGGVVEVPVLNAEPFPLVEPPGPPPITTPPVVVLLHVMPLFVPGCPVVPVTVWGFAASTTPADGSSRQAPTVREANTCFISALPFKTMLKH